MRVFQQLVATMEWRFQSGDLCNMTDVSVWRAGNLQNDVGYDIHTGIAGNGFLRKDDSMAKGKPVEISVATVFTGKQDKQQAFIELILHKRRSGSLVHLPIDAAPPDPYTDGKVFSDVCV